MSNSPYDAETIEMVNKLMVKFVPELASKYAKWPQGRILTACPFTYLGRRRAKMKITCIAPKGQKVLDIICCVASRMSINLDNRMKSEQPSIGCALQQARPLERTLMIPKKSKLSCTIEVLLMYLMMNRLQGRGIHQSTPFGPRKHRNDCRMLRSRVTMFVGGNQV